MAKRQFIISYIAALKVIAEQAQNKMFLSKLLVSKKNQKSLIMQNQPNCQYSASQDLGHCVCQPSCFPLYLIYSNAVSYKFICVECMVIYL